MSWIRGMRGATTVIGVFGSNLDRLKSRKERA
jgi:hypothetical protein